ncbi:MAG: hypothetical protein NZM65_04200 [Flavobacteriales bacterium]|nr:hypothetical protein [Flavobacteriales bacterium]MDW8409871.1 hypothetical protein [Flavobacteriales bacterium]
MKIKIVFCFLTNMIFWQYVTCQKLVFITTVEYLDLLDGGASAMHVPSSDGLEDHIPLKGLYSFAGYISEKKIKENDATIMGKIQTFLNQGWEILHVSSATQPKTDSGKPPCIITRYLLIKKV